MFNKHPLNGSYTMASFPHCPREATQQWFWGGKAAIAGAATCTSYYMSLFYIYHFIKPRNIILVSKITSSTRIQIEAFYMRIWFNCLFCLCIQTKIYLFTNGIDCHYLNLAWSSCFRNILNHVRDLFSSNIVVKFLLCILNSKTCI